MTSADAPKPPSPALRAFFAVMFFVLLVPGVAFALMIDVFFAGSDGSPTARVFQICFATALTFPALIVVGLDKRRWMRATYWAVVGVVLVLVFVPWHPRKQFVHDLHSVTPGMTVDEVESIMGGYMKGAGRKWVIPDGPAPPVRSADDPAKPAQDERVRELVLRAQDAYVAPESPPATGTMTYRWCDDDWQYDSDWGQVTFKAGRVLSVKFLPD